MSYELVVAWMDALIELWYKVRLIRTLAFASGNEYATWMGFPDRQEFHLDLCDRKWEITNLANHLNTELCIDTTHDTYDYWFFIYKGFKFFTLIDKED